MNIYKEIAKFNHIKYYDEPHKYYIGDNELISGTAFLGLFKEKFDSKAQAEKYAIKHGMSVEEVLAMWDYKGEISREKGTLVHGYAENHWQNKVFPVRGIEKFNERFGEGVMQERYDKCITIFDKFYKEASKVLVPVALELVVGDEEWGIGGMVDKLMWNEKHKQYQIWDYKTNKEISPYSKYKKRLKHPISFLHDCELDVYSLQLCLYEEIIKKNTNIKIGAKYLVHIHEDQETFNIHQCKELGDVVTQVMIPYYLKEIKK